MSLARQGTGREYNYQGNIANAVLLPEDARTTEIPQGKDGIGQRNLAYGYDTKNNPRPWVQGVLDYIASYTGPNLISG